MKNGHTAAYQQVTVVAVISGRTEAQPYSSPESIGHNTAEAENVPSPS